MENDKIMQHWPEIAELIRQRWHKLTDDDVSFPGGCATYLAALLQDRYGVNREEAKLQVYEFAGHLSATAVPQSPSREPRHVYARQAASRAMTQNIS